MKKVLASDTKEIILGLAYPKLSCYFNYVVSHRLIPEREGELCAIQRLCRNCKVRRPTTRDYIGLSRCRRSMSICALERDNLSTLNHSAEISVSQPFEEVHLNPLVGTDSRLTGTAWHSRKEASRLIANYNQLRKEGKTHKEALILSAEETEVNIRTYIVEYIQSKTILPHLNRLEEVDGQIRMVGRNGVPVIDAITADERNGSVLKASVSVESSLAGSKNRLAVINSPLGHSGLISQDGKVIRYKNNQTMVFWTDEVGELHGLTIVSDLNKKQSKELSVSLGVEETLLAGYTEAEQVANIVSNPALFSYGKAISNPAKYVFEKILSVRGNSDIKLEQEDGSVEIRSVAQTGDDIEKFESLLKFKPFWEEKLRGLRQEILAKGNKLDHPIVQAEIVRFIEETILDITVDYLEKTKHPKFQILPDNVIYFGPAFESKHNFGISLVPLDKYAIAAAFLQTRAGCAGGGGGSRTALRGVSLGFSTGSAFGSRENIGGACSECGGSSADNHYHCPDCKHKYADETNTERTKQCSCGFTFACGSGGKEE